MEKVRALLIDSEKQSVENIYVDNMTISETRELLDCKYVSSDKYRGNDLFLDELGFEDNNCLFRFRDNFVWYGGKVLMVSTGVQDNALCLTDCSLDIDYVRKAIVWCQVDDEESKKSLLPVQLMNDVSNFIKKNFGKTDEQGL